MRVSTCTFMRNDHVPSMMRTSQRPSLCSLHALRQMGFPCAVQLACGCTSWMTLRAVAYLFEIACLVCILCHLAPHVQGSTRYREMFSRSNQSSAFASNQAGYAPSHTQCLAFAVFLSPCSWCCRYAVWGKWICVPLLSKPSRC